MTASISCWRRRFLAINRAAEALPYLERIVDEFVQSQYLIEARQRIDQLKGEGT